MHSLTTGKGASVTQFAGHSVTSHVRRSHSLNEAAGRAAYGDANCWRPAISVAVLGAAGCFIQGTLIAGRLQRLARIMTRVVRSIVLLGGELSR